MYCKYASYVVISVYFKPKSCPNILLIYYQLILSLCISSWWSGNGDKIEGTRLELITFFNELHQIINESTRILPSSSSLDIGVTYLLVKHHNKQRSASFTLPKLAAPDNISKD